MSHYIIYTREPVEDIKSVFLPRREMDRWPNRCDERDVVDIFHLIDTTAIGTRNLLYRCDIKKDVTSVNSMIDRCVINAIRETISIFLVIRIRNNWTDGAFRTIAGNAFS